MKTSFILLKQELLSKKRSFLYWIIVWSLTSLLFASLYEPVKEAFAGSDVFKSIEDQPLFSSFGVTADYFASVENFLSGEYLISFVLVGCIYASFLGANTLAGSIEDKTITNILNKKIPRLEIFVAKILALLIYTLVTTIIVGFITYALFVIFTNQEDISEQFFISAFFAASIMQMLFVALGVLVGLIWGKSRSVVVGIGYIVFAWLIDSLSAVEGFPKILKYISPYNYIDFTFIAENKTIEVPGLIFIVAIIVLILVLAGLGFRNKNVQV